MLDPEMMGAVPMPGGMDAAPMMGAPPAMAPPAMVEALPIDWAALDKSPIGAQVDLSDEDEAEVVDFLKTEVERALEFHSDRNADCQDWREFYAAYKDGDDEVFENASDIAVPLIPPAVDLITARLAQIVRFAAPRFVATPLDQTVDLGQLLDFERYFNSKIDDPNAKFDESVLELIQDAAITGTSIGKIRWDKVVSHCRHYDTNPTNVNPLTGKITPKIVDEERVLYEGNIIEPIRIERFYYPPEAEWLGNAIEEAQWVGHLYEERWETARAKAKRGIYRKDVIEELRDKADQGGADSKAGSVWQDRKELEARGMIDKPKAASANAVDLFEIYMRFRCEGDENEELYLATWSHLHERLVAFRKFPFFSGRPPFCKMIYMRKPGRFQGRGIPETLRHLQDGADQIVNATLNLLQLEVRPTLFLPKDPSIKTGKQDIIRPGGVHQIEQPQAVNQVAIRGNTEGGFAALQQIAQFGHSAVGMDLAMQQPGTQSETAEGAQLRFGRDLPFFNLIAANLSNCLDSMATIFLDNLIQFHPDEDTYAFAGSTYASQPFSFRTYTLPQNANDKFKIRAQLATSAANPEIRKISMQHLQAAISQLNQQIGEKAGQWLNPGTPDAMRSLIGSAIEAELELTRNLTKTFDVPGVDRTIASWKQLEPSFQQSLQQAQEAQKAAPPPIPDAVQRTMAPDFLELDAEEQVALFGRWGIQPSALRQAAAQAAQQNAMAQQQAEGAANGQPGPEGQPGQPGAPAGAPPVQPPFPGPPMG